MYGQCVWRVYLHAPEFLQCIHLCCLWRLKSKLLAAGL